MLTCASHGIVLNVNKFQFCKKDVTFAGFQLTPTGIKPADTTLKAIRDFPIPQSITDIRSWFGLIRQVAYAHSISEQLAPFRELLKHKEGQRPKFMWNEQLNDIFENSKQHILKSVSNGIETFDPLLPTCLQCDWSKHGIGFLLLQKHCSCPEEYLSDEILKQCCNTGWRITYAGSRFTNAAESRYAPTEGEALAVAWALQTSRLFTLGCPKLIVVTDHKPLLGIFNHRDLGSIKNPRTRRIKEHTLEYSFLIRYCPGKFHLGADALSRHPVSYLNSSETTISQRCEDHLEASLYQSICIINNLEDNQQFPAVITTEKVELECLRDQEYVDLHNLVTSGFPESRKQTPDHCKVYWPLSNKGLLSTFGSIVLYNEKLVIPKVLRSPILRILHSAHQGCTGMNARACTSVYWPGMRKDIINFQSNCQTCRTISPSLAREPLKATNLPERPFQNICSDLFELNGHHYLIVVDRFSGFIHIFHSKDSPTTKFLERHLREIFMRYGRPEQLDSDGGPQFKSEAFQRFLDTWGVYHRTSSPYYPQSNGRAELAVKSAKRMLRDNVNPNGTIHNDRVACSVLQYHNTPLQDGFMSPAQLLFGRPLCDFLPMNPKAYCLHPYWADQVRKSQAARQLHHEKLTRRYNFGTRTLKPLEIAQEVVIQDQVRGSKRWNRTGIIIECLPNRQYKIRLHDTGNTTIRNRRFLKPSHTGLQRVGPYAGPLSGPNVTQVNNDASQETPVEGEERDSAVSPQPTPIRQMSPTPSNSPVSPRPRQRREPLALRKLRPFNNPGLKE